MLQSTDDGSQGQIKLTVEKPPSAHLPCRAEEVKA
jgi:hypothetical protein